MRKESSHYIEKCLESCIDCKKCMKNCPMIENYSSSPKSLLKRLAEGELMESAAYACCQCGYCEAVCPTNTPLMKVFTSIRAEAQSKKSFFSIGKGDLAVGFHQRNSFSSFFTGASQIKSKKAFFPGCSLLSYSEEVVYKTYKHMKSIDSEMGLKIYCCGKPTLDMGKSDKFEERFKSVMQSLKNQGTQELIVACANCYEVFKKYGDGMVVTSLWEWLRDNGVPKECNYRGNNLKFALHDPCPIRKRKEIHEAVRELLDDIELHFEEFEYNKEKTLCCGAGAMVKLTETKLALKQMEKRVNQTKCSHIVTYCESCVESMIDGGKPAVHVLDLIFNSEDIKARNYEQLIPKTSERWKNRRRGVQRLKEL